MTSLRGSIAVAMALLVGGTACSSRGEERNGDAEVRFRQHCARQADSSARLRASLTGETKKLGTELLLSMSFLSCANPATVSRRGSCWASGNEQCFLQSILEVEQQARTPSLPTIGADKFMRAHCDVASAVASPVATMTSFDVTESERIAAARFVTFDFAACDIKVDLEACWFRQDSDCLSRQAKLISRGSAGT